MGNITTTASSELESEFGQWLLLRTLGRRWAAMVSQAQARVDRSERLRSEHAEDPVFQQLTLAIACDLEASGRRTLALLAEADTTFDEQLATTYHSAQEAVSGGHD